MKETTTTKCEHGGAFLHGDRQSPSIALISLRHYGQGQRRALSALRNGTKHAFGTTTGVGGGAGISVHGERRDSYVGINLNRSAQ
ncbi:hypothetical protein PC114_g15959 [Phytophthora cactorum]|nr:hypothetical protein PC114_g15959 [Phytophthora cactorum]